jgi:hypothetical protein
MESWDLKSHKEILKGMKEEGVSSFDFSGVDDKTMLEIEDTLQKIETKARNDEAAAMVKASKMYLSL